LEAERSPYSAKSVLDGAPANAAGPPARMTPSDMKFPFSDEAN
jgi:hypothetical protein